MASQEDDLRQNPYLNPEAFAASKEMTEGSESDRSVAILGFSLIEDMLYELVVGIIVLPKNNTERERLFGAHGILNSAAAKIETLYRFGLLPQGIYSDLELMRKIRNGFAHPHGYKRGLKAALSFESEEMSKLTARLVSVEELVKFLKPKGVNISFQEGLNLTPRGRFVAHAFHLRSLLIIISSVAKRRRPPKTAARAS